MYFELNGKVYFNNSLVSISDIGEGYQALLCKTNKVDCCAEPPNRFGEFYYPDGKRVSIAKEGNDFYRNRGKQQIRLNLRRPGTAGHTGEYRCAIPDSSDVVKNVYITLE